MSAVHIYRSYRLATLHIESRADGFLVSAYGTWARRPRVEQATVATLQEARFAGRRLAQQVAASYEG